MINFIIKHTKLYKELLSRLKELEEALKTSRNKGNPLKKEAEDCYVIQDGKFIPCKAYR